MWDRASVNCAWQDSVQVLQACGDVLYLSVVDEGPMRNTSLAP